MLSQINNQSIWVYTFIWYQFIKQKSTFKVEAGTQTYYKYIFYDSAGYSIN